MQKNRKAMSGFTLVELLVVIAIIGILIAMLLPAVQAAREAARRMSCTNNLKQLALACHGYHDAQGKFPPAVQWPAGVAPESSSQLYQPNWVILILPYLEQQATYDLFNFSAISIAHNSNRTARGTDLSVMRCPSDSNGDVKFISNGGNWARGNYAANGGLGTPTVNYANASGLNMHGEDSAGWQNSLLRGVMGSNASVSIAQITDGTSSTFLLGEIRIGLLPELDRRGIWAMGGAGTSALFWYGYMGDSPGPNSCGDRADDIEGCHTAFNQNPGLYRQECMQCIEVARPSVQATMRSRHPGGVNTVFCDGSVHFISDHIETSVAFDGNFGSTWDRLIASADGSVIDASEVEF